MRQSASTTRHSDIRGLLAAHPLASGAQACADLFKPAGRGLSAEPRPARPQVVFDDGPIGIVLELELPQPPAMTLRSSVSVPEHQASR